MNKKDWGFEDCLLHDIYHHNQTAHPIKLGATRVVLFRFSKFLRSQHAT